MARAPRDRLRRRLARRQLRPLYGTQACAGADHDSTFGDRIGQGKENVRQFLKDNPDIADEIDAKIRAELMPEKAPKAAPKAPEAPAVD